MNVASLELCQDLYELSGWVGAHAAYAHAQWVQDGSIEHRYRLRHTKVKRDDPMDVPAYDLGYLLRKLEHVHLTSVDGVWECASRVKRDEVKFAETPEDAACKLAIELFKQGVLTREAA